MSPDFGARRVEEEIAAPHLPPYPAYKPSGVEWLGDVPAHWEAVQLGRIGRFSKGSGGTKADEVPEGVPCIRYGDLYTSHKFHIRASRSCVSETDALNYTPLRHGDILFAGSGETIEEIGKSAVNLIDQPACCGGDVILFRSAREIDATFSGYAIDCPASQYQKSTMGRGITVMHIYGSELKYLWIALPPLPEQHAIARYLDHVDRRIHRYIQAKQKRITLLHEARQAIIHRAVTRGLDSAVPLKPSGVDWLGDVPAHWEVRRLRYLIEGNLTYGANAAAEYDNSNWPRYLRITDFALDGTLRKDTFRSLPPEIAKDYLVEPGDLLLARSGATVGKAFLVTSETSQACHAGYLIRARPRRSLIEPKFLFAFTQSPCFMRWKDSTFIIATIQNISAEKYASLPVPAPPLPEQRAIVAHLDQATAAIDAAIDSARRQSELMREYRASLIAHVVTGKLDVRAAAERLPDETNN